MTNLQKVEILLLCVFCFLLGNRIPVFTNLKTMICGDIEKQTKQLEANTFQSTTTNRLSPSVLNGVIELESDTEN